MVIREDARERFKTREAMTTRQRSVMPQQALRRSMLDGVKRGRERLQRKADDATKPSPEVYSVEKIEAETVHLTNYVPVAGRFGMRALWKRKREKEKDYVNRGALHTSPNSSAVQAQAPRREAVRRMREQTPIMRENAGKAADRLARALEEILEKAAAAVVEKGWVALAVPLAVLVLFGGLAAAIFGSPVGVVTGGGADGTPSIPEVPRVLDEELTDHIAGVQAAYGELDETNLNFTGSMTDIVATFAVRVGMDSAEPLDVLTMDAKRQRLLREVYWDMMDIGAVLTETEVETEELDENDEPVTEIYRVLDLSVTTKPCGEIASRYSFTTEQQAMLAELMTEPLCSMLMGFCGSNASLMLTPEQLTELNALLSEDLDPLRRQVVMTAYSLVGKVSYFWGGKSEMLGWDTRWGTPAVITSEGTDATGTIARFGLDCSGFVTWVFINALQDTTAAGLIGHGTSSQWSNCVPISWDEAQPGDLIWVAPGWATDNHIGILVGKDEAGQWRVCHCAGGVGVTVTDAGMFRYVRRAAMMFHGTC